MLRTPGHHHGGSHRTALERLLPGLPRRLPPFSFLLSFLASGHLTMLCGPALLQLRDAPARQPRTPRLT